MTSEVVVDETTGRKYTLDAPDELQPGEQVVFLLNLHGGGSHGTWQYLYFPAHEHCNTYRLIVATPSAATREPARRWVAEADDEHLTAIVDQVIAKHGKESIRAFWLIGHSQGGMPFGQGHGGRRFLGQTLMSLISNSNLGHIP